MPRELGPGVTKVTVRFSRKVPEGVVNDFVKVEPKVTGVGLVRAIVIPDAKPMLFVKMVVTMSGAPDVIVVAVVTSPVLAVKMSVGTKLNVTSIGIAFAALPISMVTQAAAAI